jgi:hypothetical protein
MGISFVSDNVGRSRLIITDEPEYIVPLQIAPPALEDHLQRGKWLVIGMSVWSIHDRQSGLRAVDLVTRLGGVVKLGLRPVDYHEENAAWVPDYEPGEQTEILVAERAGAREVTIRQKSEASPIWVAIAEGTIVRVTKGRLTDAEIAQLLSELCAIPA